MSSLSSLCLNSEFTEGGCPCLHPGQAMLCIQKEMSSPPGDQSDNTAKVCRNEVRKWDCAQSVVGPEHSDK